MNPNDYAPGPIIDTPELLAAVLAHEDAVFCDGAFKWCKALRASEQVDGVAPEDWLDWYNEIRRANLKCSPATMEAMRKP